MSIETTIDRVLDAMYQECLNGVIGLELCETEDDLAKWKKRYLGKDSLFNIVIRELFKKDDID